MNTRKPVDGEGRGSEEGVFKQQVFDTCPFPIVLVDMGTRRCIECNPAAVLIYGFSSREELLGKSVTEISPPFQYDGTPSEDALRQIDEAIEEGLTFFEWRHCRPDGTLWDAEIHLHLFSSGERKLLQMMPIDITERKRTEEALRTKELELRTLMNHIPNIIIRYDNRKRVTFLNRLVPGVMDVPEGYAGKTIDELGLPPTIAAEINKNIQNAIESRKPVPTSYTLPTSFGPRHFETVTVPEFSDNGELQSVIAISQDVTERRQAEKALQETEGQFRELFMSISDGFYLAETLYDDSGRPFDYRYLEVNPAFERIVGLDRSRIVGRTYREVVPVDTTQWLDNYFRVAVTGKPSTFSFYSNEYRMHFETYAYKTAKDRIAVFVRDVTERKRTEEALRNFQKLEALGLLAGGIAHDFNNLLGGIFGYIDLATQTADKTASDYLARALATIERARGLTRQLLTFAKGGVPVKTRERFSPFIEETVRFALSGSKCTCEFRIPDNLWTAEFDRNQIGQVIDNIVINAQQAMPLGGVIEVTAENKTLGTRDIATLPAGNYVKISVKDHGIGMPAEILPRIFDPFFTTKPRGHGLGLSTCYSIINRHGGAIEVESVPGCGSTFHVYLPASADVESTAAAVSASAAAYRGSGLFLVMDDEPVILDIIEGMLESFGHMVLRTTDGSEALSVFKADRSACREIVAAIFDLTVPGGMGGREAIGEIRAIDRQFPVFVASGYADDPVMAHPTDYGFTASICKPFKRIELAELLRKHLGKAG